MSPTEFSRVLNSFYSGVSDVLVQEDAFIDNMIGDEVMAVFIPAFTGPDHATAGIRAARALLETAVRSEGFAVPIGVGVHTGVAYFGTITGAQGAFSDLTALGDSVNLAARLASMAGPGEALISDSTYERANLDVGETEARRLDVKGKKDPVSVRVLRPAGD